MIVQIRELTPVTLTRKRGIDAYRRLLDILNQERAIEIDLSEPIMLSMSFLDELVWRLAQAGHLRKVVFVAQTASVRRKLGNISYERGVNIHFKKEAGEG